MGLSDGLFDRIPTGSLITLDTAPIIYFLQDHPQFARKFVPLFEAVARGELLIAISTITLAEVLSGPLREGNEFAAAQYREVLIASPGWRLVPVDEEIAVTAARIRSRHRLRLPDAIQAATAIVSRSHALVTHDSDLAKIKDIPVIGI